MICSGHVDTELAALGRPHHPQSAGRARRQALATYGKFYLFLREIRHELFDAEFEQRLAHAYATPRGTSPHPPAFLAMVLLLQAYDQISDADAVDEALMDRRWQLVLDCLGCEEAPFSQGVLVQFRERLIAHDSTASCWSAPSRSRSAVARSAGST